MPSVPRPNLIERRLSRFLREPVSVRGAASVIVVATAVIVVASGVAIRALDRHEYTSIWEGMWWALQTVTTVGYGDVTPESVAGRFVAGAVMLLGVALVAIVTAAVTSSFVARAEEQRGADNATEGDLAAERLDARLQDIIARLDRVERMLRTPNEQPPSAGGR
jgi:voltage-gated potassium channel Kch